MLIRSTNELAVNARNTEDQSIKKIVLITEPINNGGGFGVGIRINIGEKSAVVSGKTLLQAVKNCLAGSK